MHLPRGCSNDTRIFHGAALEAGYVLDHTKNTTLVYVSERGTIAFPMHPKDFRALKNAIAGLQRATGSRPALDEQERKERSAAKVEKQIAKRTTAEQIIQAYGLELGLDLTFGQAHRILNQEGSIRAAKTFLRRLVGQHIVREASKSA